MKKYALALAAAGALVSASLAQADTLADVKARGTLKCGVNQGLLGFSAKDDKGQWTGFDVDLCRAVASAVLGDASKVDYVPLSAEARFPALQKGEIDLLSRNSTWTLGREAELKLQFPGVSYYDGQGFLVPVAKKVDSALELTNSKVCVQAGTTSVLNARDYSSQNNLSLELVELPGVDEVVKGYADGRCDVITTDVSQLYALRLKLAKPADHIVLPDVISKEPLGPVVRQGDDQWFDIVRYVVFALVEAEELGISRANAEQMLATSPSPAVQRLLGKTGDLGPSIGLDRAWLLTAIKAVGNYGEIYDRHLGKDSPVQLPRGLNDLWTRGGLMIAPPIR